MTERGKGGRRSNKSIADVIDLVSGSGGRVLSGTYRNNRSRFEIRCARGHLFQSDLMHLQNGQWCPDCAPNRAIDYDLVCDAAQAAGLEVLGKREDFDKKRVEVRCRQCGKGWQADAYRIMEGRGCRVCGFQKMWDTRRSRGRQRSAA